MSKQLSLGIALRDSATFENFCIGRNQVVMDSLQQMIAGQGEQFLYCYGPQGVGKSHLLQGVCHGLGARQESSFYLPLQMHHELSPLMLEGLEQLNLIALDDIDVVLGIKEWEEALFHFYNRIRASEVQLIVTAKKPPQQLKCLLPDLQSRLAWGLVLGLQELTDEEKIQVLQMRADQRGFEMSIEVAKYLLHHQSRQMSDLLAVLDILDKASLEAKHRLTIPFVKSVLDHSI